MAYTLSSTPTGLHFGSTASPALQALLTASIDYAGLFPPADLPLAACLQKHAAYVRSAEAWMLNSLVLPVATFAAAAEHFPAFDRSRPLRISALAGKGQARFEQNVDSAVAAVRQLHSASGEHVVVVQLELAVPSDCDLRLLSALHALTNELNLRVFCEAAPSDAERTIACIAQHNTSYDAHLGYKLRTGGVTAEAFPDCDEVARALVAALRDTVPIKFTAGLHHPVRQFRDEVGAKMHGFLNVLGAGVLAAEHGWDEAITSEMLADENVESFRFDGEMFSWREWNISATAIRGRRKLVTSFGSCSFDEPRNDLRSLRLL